MIDENGNEIVIAAPTVSGENVPPIAADPDRCDSMMAPADQIAKGRHIKLYLIS
jgi:hypothetical protein